MIVISLAVSLLALPGKEARAVSCFTENHEKSREFHAVRLFPVSPCCPHSCEIPLNFVISYFVENTKVAHS